MALFNMQRVVESAYDSKFYLWLLNIGLQRMIPFNRPHGYKILEISKSEMIALLPFKKANLNHIKSIHACSMATIAEFTTGFLLISNLDASKYRLIMRKIEMEYFYQGKMDARVHFKISPQWLESEVIKPVEKEGKVEVVCSVQINDIDGNKLSEGHVTWQIKRWDLVKTKL